MAVDVGQGFNECSVKFSKGMMETCSCVVVALAQRCCVLSVSDFGAESRGRCFGFARESKESDLKAESLKGDPGGRSQCFKIFVCSLAARWTDDCCLY